MEPTAQQIQDLKALVKSNLWATYKLFVEDEIKDLETQMFENEKLDEKQRDAIRNKRNNLKYALEFPAKVIEDFKPRKSHKEPDNETY